MKRKEKAAVEIESLRASETFYLCQLHGHGHERKKVLVSGHIDGNKSRR